MSPIFAFSPLILEFTLTAVLIELTPGPNMAYLAALALASGKRVGFAAVAGICLGLTGIGILAAFGLAAFLDQVPLAYEALRYCGAAFMFYLAWEGWQGAAGEGDHALTARGAFIRALITNLLNPKAALFYVAVLPLFLDASSAKADGGLGGQTFVLAAIYVAIATLIHLLIVLFADALRPYLVSGNREKITRRILSASLALVALWFFLGTRR
jgi:threonine/homoserine/homoserine lactone efflux protein